MSEEREKTCTSCFSQTLKSKFLGKNFCRAIPICAFTDDGNDVKSQRMTAKESYLFYFICMSNSIFWSNKSLSPRHSPYRNSRIKFREKQRRQPQPRFPTSPHSHRAGVGGCACEQHAALFLVVHAPPCELCKEPGRWPKSPFLCAPICRREIFFFGSQNRCATTRERPRIIFFYAKKHTRPQLQIKKKNAIF